MLRGHSKRPGISLKGYSVPEWYQDAKFGIFIHWGPYCVPAFGNEWYPRNMYRQGSNEYEHHLDTYGRTRNSAIRISFRMFKAEKFDAAALGSSSSRKRAPLCGAGGRTSRRLPDVRLHSTKLERCRDGTEARS